MAKIEWMKYITLGAGAVLAPALVAMIPGVPGMLANIPYWGQQLVGGITLGGAVLSMTGVGIVDYFMLKRR